LEKKLGRAFTSPSLPPPGAHRELARDTLAYLHITIGTLPCRSGKGPRAHEMWLRSLSALLLCRARGGPDRKTESPGNGAATA
jgi:hypothetical protein